MEDKNGAFPAYSLGNKCSLSYAEKCCVENVER